MTAAVLRVNAEEEMLLSGKGNEQKNVNSGTTRKRIGMDNSINTPTVPGGASPFLRIYVKVSHIRRIPEVKLHSSLIPHQFFGYY